MRTGAAVLVVTAFTLVACGGNEAETTESAGVSSEVSVDSIRIASGSMSVGNPAPTTPPATPRSSPSPPSEDFGISDVRLENGHAVVTFFGDGVVNYVGRYVDSATVYGRGDVLDVPGSSILQLDLIAAPSPIPGSSTRPVQSAPDADGIVSIQTTEPSSGVTQSFLGTSTDRPQFTVTPQQNPPSLIVSVS